MRRGFAIGMAALVALFLASTGTGMPVEITATDTAGNSTSAGRRIKQK